MAREITYNNFEISLVVFIPNMTTNHAITCTNITVSVLHIKELECKVEKLKHMNEDKKQT